MNKISDELIFDVIGQIYRAVKQHYDESRLLGLYVFGKANYGLAETLDDLEVEVVYIPTIEEMCLSTEMKQESMKYVDMEKNFSTDIKITDFRYANHMSEKANTMIESLYTEYYIINSKYKTLYERLLRDNRDTFAYFNKNKKIMSAAARGTELAYKYIDTNLNTAHADWHFRLCWIDYVLKQYINEVPFENILNINDSVIRSNLLRIKHGNILKEDLETIFDFKHTFKSYMRDLQPENDKVCPELQKAILEIVQAAMINDSHIVEFLKMITDAERAALSAILNAIDGEGTISISQLVEKTCLSRPVFNNLLLKMKQTKVAEIKNQGVKGTYIRITNNSLYNVTK